MNTVNGPESSSDSESILARQPWRCLKLSSFCVTDQNRPTLLGSVLAGFREVRVIHGRGRGVQRNRVQRRLERNPLVERFADAPADRGGWGATLVWLRTEPADVTDTSR